MKSRKDQISCIVEETLLEAQGGYMSGLRMGAFPREGDRLPERHDAVGLHRQERTLTRLSADPSVSPFMRSAAAEQLRDVQRDIMSAADPAAREKLIQRTIKGVRTGKRLRKYVIEPVKGLFASVGTKAFNVATSADAGTLRGKGYKV
jgi:hypothetical protein